MATLTTKITETFSMNGSTLNSEATYEMDNISGYLKQIVNMGTTYYPMFIAGTDAAGIVWDMDEVLYLRLSNTIDTTASGEDLLVKIGVSSGSDYIVHRIEKGNSLILTSFNNAIAISTSDLTTNVPSSDDLDSLSIKTMSGTTDIEIFVANKQT